MFDGAHIWNSLPNEISENNSRMSFETRIAYSQFLNDNVQKSCK